jgi:ABC-2 type transport system ATP-binding protein
MLFFLCRQKKGGFQVETTIQVEDLCKAYGSVRAVEQVGFTVRRGEVFGLLGAQWGGKKHGH